jgi:hypothetical protein
VKNLTASKVHIAQNCIAWLAEDAVWGPDKPTYGQRTGRGFHSAVEYRIGTGNIPSERICEECSLTARQRRAMAGMLGHWIDWFDARPELREGRTDLEVPFAYDPVRGTSRLLKRGAHREYAGILPHEVGGTIDLLHEQLDGTIYVYDWKTGGIWTDPPRANAQIRTLALMVDRLHARVASGYHKPVIGVLVGIPEKEPVRTQMHEFTSFELDVMADELREIHERRKLPVMHAPYTKGCNACPAKTTCPESVWKGRKAA